jgi:ribosomal protein S20
MAFTGSQAELNERKQALQDYAQDIPPDIIDFLVHEDFESVDTYLHVLNLEPALDQRIRALQDVRALKQIYTDFQQKSLNQTQAVNSAVEATRISTTSTKQINIQQNSDELEKKQVSIQQTLDELEKIGILPARRFGSESAYWKALGDYLEKRKAAIVYVKDAERSGQSLPKTETAPGQTYIYYDKKEFSERGITPTKWFTNLFLTSVAGGRTIKDAYGHPAHGIEPLGVKTAPAHNLVIATNQYIPTYGGYFGKERFAQEGEKRATVVSAYAFEFEKYSATNAHTCSLLKVTDKALSAPDYEKVANITNGQFSKENTGKTVYLDVQAYKTYVRDNLLNQLRAIVHSHQQAGLSDKNIQVNLGLPGLGFFSNLGGSRDFSLAKKLAGPAAEAYEEALRTFGYEQAHSPLKIAAVRLSYPADPNFAYEAKALVDAFKTTSTSVPNNINDIKVALTTKNIEQLDNDPTVRQAIVMNEDPRAHVGNEQRPDSQGPGVMANVVGGRENMNPVINPLSTLKVGHVFSHDQVAKAELTAKAEIKTELEAAHLKNLDTLQSTYNAQNNAQMHPNQMPAVVSSAQLTRNAIDKTSFSPEIKRDRFNFKASTVPKAFKSAIINATKTVTNAITNNASSLKDAAKDVAKEAHEIIDKNITRRKP